MPFQRGALLEQQKKYAEAEQAFRSVLARDPLHAPTLNYLGYMLAERGDRLDEAIQLITPGADRSIPYNGSYLDSLGWAWFKKGDAAKARGYLERAADAVAAQLGRAGPLRRRAGGVEATARGGGRRVGDARSTGDLDQMDADRHQAEDRCMRASGR